MPPKPQTNRAGSPASSGAAQGSKLGQTVSGGGGGNKTTAASSSGTNKGGARRRPMELGDVPLDELPIFEPTVFAVPELSEKRTFDLAAALQTVDGIPAPDVTVSIATPLPSGTAGAVPTADMLLLELLAQPPVDATGVTKQPPRPRSGSTSARLARRRTTVSQIEKQQAQARQQYNAVARVDVALSLRALYRRNHPSGLRAHEELSSHLNVNIADVIHAERVLSLPNIGTSPPALQESTTSRLGDGSAVNSVRSGLERRASSLGTSPRAAGQTPSTMSQYECATMGLPALAVLLLRLWSTDDDTITQFFGTGKPDRFGGLAEMTGVVGDGLDAERRKAAIVSKLRDVIREHAARASGVANRQTFPLRDELHRALHLRDKEAMARWSGTGALILAAIAHIYRGLQPVPPSPIAVQLPDTEGILRAAAAAKKAAAKKSAKDSPAGANSTARRGSSSGAPPAASSIRGGQKGGRSASPGGKKAAAKTSSPAKKLPEFVNYDPLEGLPPDAVFCTHTLVYNEGDDARAAFEKFISAVDLGGSVDAPLLLPFHVSSVEPVVEELKRVETNEGNPEEQSAAAPPLTTPYEIYEAFSGVASEAQKVARAAEACRGYDRDPPSARMLTISVVAPLSAIVPLTPLALGAAPVPSPATRNRAPAAAGIAPGSAAASTTIASGSRVPLHAADLASEAGTSTDPRHILARTARTRGGGTIPIEGSIRSAALGGTASSTVRRESSSVAGTCFPNLFTPAVFPQGTTWRLATFKPAANHLVFAYGGMHPASDGANLALFLDTVLSDCNRADQVARNIHNRLTLRFVRPHHCHRHTAQKYSRYCLTCRQFICRACFGERHSHHETLPHARFCTMQSAALDPKKNILLGRLEVLARLRTGLAGEEARMHALVDSSIDDVRRRLEARRAALHADVNARAAMHHAAVSDELRSWQEHGREVQRTLDTVAEAKAGRVNGIKVIRKCVPIGVRDVYGVQLPANELKLLAKVLTWSNPSQYLTNAIYPPTDNTQPPGADQVFVPASNSEGAFGHPSSSGVIGSGSVGGLEEGGNEDQATFSTSSNPAAKTSAMNA